MSGLIGLNFKPDPSSAPRPLILGVDPGLSGAYALIEIDTQRLIDVGSLPTFQKDGARKGHKPSTRVHFDCHAFSSTIDLYAPLIALCVLEEPGARPKQGLSSTFRFGHVCGQVHGVLAGHYLPVLPIRPEIWKLSMGLSSDKAESLRRVKALWPQDENLFKLKKDNDKAEACLLGMYGIRHQKRMIELCRKGFKK